MKKLVLFLLLSTLAMAAEGYHATFVVKNSGSVARYVGVKFLAWTGEEFEPDYQTPFTLVEPGQTKTVSYYSAYDPSQVWLVTDIDATLTGASLIYSSGAGEEYEIASLFPGYAETAPDGAVKYITLLQTEALENGGKPIWTNGSSTLDGALYREGVDLTVAAIKGANAGASTGGSGGDGDPAADSNRELIATKQLALSQSNVGMSINNTTGALTIAHPENFDGTGTAAGAALTEINSIFVTTPVQENPFEMPTMPATPSILAITMPPSFGGATIDFNPFSETRLGPVADWFRAAVAWLTIALFGVYMWNEIKRNTTQIMSAPQAKGNAVAAGTGAQATAAFAAAAITVIVFSSLSALVGFAFDGINPFSVITTMSASPLATMPSGAYWMVNSLLPCATIISCFLGKFFFGLYGAAVYAGAATVIRFVVP